GRGKARHCRDCHQPSLVHRRPAPSPLTPGTTANSVKFRFLAMNIVDGLWHSGYLPQQVAEGGFSSVRGPRAPTEHGAAMVPPSPAVATAPSSYRSFALASACGGVFVWGDRSQLLCPRSRSTNMAKRAARRAKLHAIDNDRIHNLV